MRLSFFLCLLLPSCLQLKIVLMSKWQIWGRHILISCTTEEEASSVRTVLFCSEFYVRSTNSSGKGNEGVALKISALVLAGHVDSMTLTSIH